VVRRRRRRRRRKNVWAPFGIVLITPRLCGAGTVLY